MSLVVKDFIDLIVLMNPKYNEYRAKLIAENLIYSYSVFDRIYHSLVHIEFGLNLLKDVKDLCDNYLSVVYAWWYHDFIYTPGSSVNELASADSARHNAFLLGLEADVSMSAFRLIMATRHDMPYLDTDDEEISSIILNDQKIIHDVDLAILGADLRIYNEYVANIEIEYSDFSLKAYNEGRLIFLKTLLELDHIFYIKYFQDRFEERAKENLTREIKEIEKTIASL